MYKNAYKQPYLFSVPFRYDKANLAKWEDAYKKMWYMHVSDGTPLSLARKVATDGWEPSETSRFMSWVSFYSHEDDLKYKHSTTRLENFVKLANGLHDKRERIPNLLSIIKEGDNPLRQIQESAFQNMSYSEDLDQMKKFIFGRIRSIRKTLLSKGSTLAVDEAVKILNNLESAILNLQIRKTAEDVIYRACKQLRFNGFDKIATGLTEDDEEVKLEALFAVMRDVQDHITQQNIPRALAEVFSMDQKGDYSEVAEALSRMIDAYRYSSSRVGDVISRMSLRISGIQHKKMMQDRTSKEITEVVDENKPSEESEGASKRPRYMTKAPVPQKGSGESFKPRFPGV